MNQYLIAIIIATLAYAIFAFISMRFSASNTDDIVIKRRGVRTAGHTKRLGDVRKQISGVLEEKANVTKKYQTETLCLQAGYELSYGEYKILCISIAIALPLVMLLLLNNIFLALVFAIMGYLLPGQVFKFQANKRVMKMEDQVGSFIRIVLERYKTNKDLSKSIVQTLPDFKGHEPLYSTLKQAVVDINVGMPSDEALDRLTRRTGSRFLARFSDYYKITENLATHESKVELLNQAFLQYDENRQLKSLLRKEIAGPVREAYIMVAATPVFMAYQSFATDGYLDFMLNDQMGQIGLAVVVLVLLACVWFINVKLGAPIE